MLVEKALVNKCQGRLKILVEQVEIIFADLVGEEHALVDDRPGGHGYRIKSIVAAFGFRLYPVGDHLAHKINLALISVLVVELPSPPPMKTCMCTGSDAAISGAFESEELSTGTNAGAEQAQPFGSNALFDD